MKTLKKLSVLFILVSFQFFAQNKESKSASVNSFVDPNTPANAKPPGISGNWILDFSDEFNTTDINPLKWNKIISTSSRGGRTNLGLTNWWWKSQNAFLNGTADLVLRGTKVNSITMY